MTVVVSFITAARVGGDAQGIGRVRRQERITVPGTTANPTEVGEAVIISNGEANMVAVAWGSIPDAAALVETAVTSAGFGVPAGQMAIPFSPGGGKLINIKAVS